MELAIQQVKITSLLLGTVKVRQLTIIHGMSHYNIATGSSDQVTSSREIEDCSVIYVNDVISAMCSYSGGSSVTGFQLIVQLNNVDEVYKLHINSTTEHLSPEPVTIRVEKNRTYHVAILSLMGERRIVDTDIVYSQVLSPNIQGIVTVTIV